MEQSGAIEYAYPDWFLLMLDKYFNPVFIRLFKGEDQDAAADPKKRPEKIRTVTA